MRKSEKRFARWLRSLDEDWWDDAADGGEFLCSLQEAFTAGWKAAHREPSARLRATFSGHVTHNGNTIPGELVIFLGGTYKDGHVTMAIEEASFAALKQGLISCGVL